jgi:DHHC palmitoyltransferase
MYSTIKEYFSPSKSKDEGDTVDSINDDVTNGNGSPALENGTKKASTSSSVSASLAQPPSETTSLLGHPNAPVDDDDDTTTRKQLFADETTSFPPPPPPPPPSHHNNVIVEDDPVHPLPSHSPSVYDFYFDPSRNPTVQRYYRFQASPITPIVALHKQPGGGGGMASGGGVTGLLRRSAVVPSHGTDASGDWILVSVGGRSGWARKKQPHQHFSGFTLAEQFRATEGWMGNHAFFCNGKCMLGSDAPSLVFTNVLIAVGYVWHFCIVLPKLQQMELQGHLQLGSNNLWSSHQNDQTTNNDTPITTTLWWWSVALGLLSVVMLWVSALMDPGIIPPVSSPVKAPIPHQKVPLGGPLGYRYCSTCNIFRPPRSKHCNSCNVCVSKFDQ